MLVSGSLDSKMLMWDISDKLKYPKRGYILSNKGDTANYSLSSNEGLISKRPQTETVNEEWLHRCWTFWQRT